MNQKFDLVIIGAGCVGIAAAYYALKMNRSVCIVEKNVIGDQKKFWNQSFMARQNRLQYNQEYLTRFMRMSNDEWRTVQQELGKGKCFLHRQGTLWLGEKNVNTTEGNIKAAHETITEINSTLKEGEKKVESLYMEKIIQESPEYMRAFKPPHQKQWDSWSALYQPDGGSVDVKASYDAFYLYIKQHGDRVTVYENTSVVKHELTKAECKHKFTTSSNKVIQSKSVFICTGIFTPHFLKDVMKYPHLVDNNFKNGVTNRQYVIEQYVNSYFKIEEGYENFYSHMPSFVNFMKENRHQSNFTTYGFPFHSWDSMKAGYFIKLGTTAHKRIHSMQEEKQFFKTFSFDIVSQDDHRVHAAVNYAMKRMNGISAKSPLNRHFPYPIIYYQGKQTLLDYMQRKDESVVVQSGGCIISEYPLIAKTVIQMLFEPNKIKNARQQMTVVGNFLNRTRFPLKPYVNDRLCKLNYSYPKNGEFKTVVIGAGCSGMYAAYRLNKSNKDNIGVFDLSERISGGLQSFQILRTNTPMELEQMKYIPDRHTILNQLVMCLGIPSIRFPIEGEKNQTSMRKSSMRTESYRMMDWQAKQKMDSRVMPSMRMKGHLLGMTAYQIISFSLYQILTAPENIGVITELFLQKTKEDIAMQREKMKSMGQMFSPQDIFYRSWKNYIYQQKGNPLSYRTNLMLQQWNKIRPILLFRFPYQVKERDIYEGQEKVDMSHLYPLYKFGFQNALQSQFGHQTYQFVAEQNGYYSNTSNASYLDQVMVYFLDYGDVTYRTLSGGFDNINYAMANELLDEQKGLSSKNGGIYLGHKLVNIQKSNSKYLLTFHVKDENTPVPLEDSFRCKLLSGVKKTKLFNLIHKQLGVPVPLPDKKGFSSIQFVADRLILGIPKKSIRMLYNEIDLLQEPISTYEQYYKSDRRLYQSLFNYSSLKEQLPKVKKFLPLSSSECEQKEKLMMRQECCTEAHKSGHQDHKLSQNQMKRLSQLTERSFYEKVISRSSIDIKYEEEKLKRFTEDQPIAPKSLCNLIETTQSIPGMKIVMNFTKNWWDPIERITQSCCEQPTKNMSLSKTIQEIRGVSSNDLSIRHTLQVSMGEDNLLVCSFNDRLTTEFWITLHNNFEKVWHPKPEIQKEMKQGTGKHLISCSPTQSIYPAKEVLVKEILKELGRIYNIEVREEWLKECVYQFLGNDLFGSSCHHFNSGYYIPSIMQTMRKPWKDEAIHFVGQAYSNTSGWVQGAFQTTELLLQKQIGLTPLVKGYYAGY